MRTHELNSANLIKVSWENETLRVYINNGQIIAYKNVPEGLFVGMCSAKSAGTYLRLYIARQYTYELEKKSDLNAQNDSLEHYKNITVGMWATDKPELIPEDIKHLFVELNYSEVVV